MTLMTYISKINFLQFRVLLNYESFRQFRKKSASFVGYFEARSPKLFLIDPKIVRDVTITYFNNFRDSGFGKIVRI